MIYIGIVNVKNLKTEKTALFRLPQNIAEIIDKTGNEKEKKLRTGAYLLLKSLYFEHYFKKSENRDAGCEKLPNISFSECGKPYFEGLKTPIFNISHSEEFAVVAMSDKVEAVGVDIQCEPKLKSSLENASKRFFAPFKKCDTGVYCSQNSPDFEEELAVTFYSPKSSDEDGAVLMKENTYPSFSFLPDKESFDDKLVIWTLLEAVLKMHGDGFGAYSGAEKIISDSKTKSATFKSGGKRYAFSISYK